MTRAFIVQLDVQDTDESTLSGMAEDIQDSLETDGMAVITVRPWGGEQPSTSPISPLEEPPVQTGLQQIFQP